MYKVGDKVIVTDIRIIYLPDEMIGKTYQISRIKLGSGNIKTVYYLKVGKLEYGTFDTQFKRASKLANLL